tara:strand:- start:309 stop:1031 length:723 start_codon:yes stop_codon:yes gene_type:complete
MNNNEIKERVERERAWHDERFHYDTRDESTGTFYFALEDWYKDYLEIIFESDANKNILELGAGLETIALKSDINFSLTSVDISTKAINFLSTKIQSSNIKFEIQDVHDMSYQNDTFDLILARGVLHHLEINTGIAEISRVLKKDGKILFGEPLSGNPLIRLYRYLTPQLRTPDERPLSGKDIKFIKNSFDKVTIDYYGFFTLIFAILLKRHSPFARSLDKFFLNKLGLGRFLAWSCIIKN